MSSPTSLPAEQPGAALTALGRYGGRNTAAEHGTEAARLGDMMPHRMYLTGALRGGGGFTHEQRSGRLHPHACGLAHTTAIRCCYIPVVSVTVYQ
ncbi:DUF6245 family protein [Planomonospora parontospora]|uniref:DUF6245 family protein n=1 Tax=Planomonospora parontospora TaxID=58119 RepID=UPI00357110E3